MKTGFWILLAIIILLVAGWAAISFTLWLLWTVITGFVIGAFGRMVVSGGDGVSTGMTVLAGIGGSLIGGIAANIMDSGTVVRLLMSVLGAAVLVLLLREGPRGAKS